MLTQQLGVNQEQAKGGAGLLFGLAKEKLGDDEYGRVESALPGIGSLIGAAPSGGGLGGMVASVAGAFGGSGTAVGNLAGLAGGFEKLGLDAGMIGKFIPIILAFAQSKGGDAVKDLLAKVLKV